MLKSTNGLMIFVRNILHYLRLSLLLVALVSILQSCGGLKNKRLNKELEATFKTPPFSNHHSGFLVLDLQSGDTLFNRSASRYFVPASNVKIFTLYTALKLIPENVPALRYKIASDTLYFEGTADPGALHPIFNDSTAIKFIDSYPTPVLVETNFNEDAWPNGWSWEDYDRYFAAERSSLPLYGNVVQFYQDSTKSVIPEYYTDSISSQPASFKRASDRNLFYITNADPDSLEVPIKLRPGLMAELLTSALGRKIHTRNVFPPGPKNTLYGILRDTLLQQMMVESDNFIAEQLLLMASSKLSDTLSSATAINHMKENDLSILKQSPRWVDGSGLSRYNLFTPESMVQLLQLLYSEYGANSVLEYFPVGGNSGTLQDDFKSDEEPYLYAKSGSMGNIYCLSGYLKTAAGRTLVFSFMNNNFRISQSDIRKEIHTILESLRENY